MEATREQRSLAELLAEADALVAKYGPRWQSDPDADGPWWFVDTASKASPVVVEVRMKDTGGWWFWYAGIECAEHSSALLPSWRFRRVPRAPALP